MAESQGPNNDIVNPVVGMAYESVYPAFGVNILAGWGNDFWMQNISPRVIRESAVITTTGYQAGSQGTQETVSEFVVGPAGPGGAPGAPGGPGTPGWNGIDGVTNIITWATCPDITADSSANTLDPGENATATVDVEQGTQTCSTSMTFTFGLPKGDTGPAGPAGSGADQAKIISKAVTGTGAANNRLVQYTVTTVGWNPATLEWDVSGGGSTYTNVLNMDEVRRKGTDHVGLDLPAGGGANDDVIAVDVIERNVIGGGTNRFFEKKLPQTFLAKVTGITGDTGDHTTQCTFAYTVEDVRGVGTLANSSSSPLTPIAQRPAVGQLVPPSTGDYVLMGWKEDVDDSSAQQLVLLDAYETFAVTVCQTQGILDFSDPNNGGYVFIMFGPYV